MGHFKDPEKRKTKMAVFRVTLEDYEQMVLNSRLAGYGSLTKYICDLCLQKGGKRRGGAAEERDMISTLTEETLSIVKKYNAIYEKITVLTDSEREPKTKTKIIAEVARLNRTTEKLVEQYRQIKQLIEGIEENESN